MIDTTTKSFESLYRKNGVTGIPCEEADIDSLQQQLGVELPPSYKAFLLLAGQGCQPLQGSNYALEDDLAELQRAGQRIAAHEKTNLPAGAFVFLLHQGFACQVSRIMSINEDANCPQCSDHEFPRCRPCGTFSVYAGRILLGKSELEIETIDEEGFYRNGSFEPVFEAYLPFQDLFRRYQNLKLEQHLRLPAYKLMPELETCEREIQKVGLRLVAPNGEDVPTQRFELADCELNVFIADPTVYARYFPPGAENA